MYGGYFGAAQGVLLMAILGIGVAETLQRHNATKNVLALIVNAVAAVVFIVVADVDWAVAGLIAVGSVIGGQIGATVGRRLPPLVLRAVIVVVGVVALASFLLGLSRPGPQRSAAARRPERTAATSTRRRQARGVMLWLWIGSRRWCSASIRWACGRRGEPMPGRGRLQQGLRRRRRRPSPDSRPRTTVGSPASVRRRRGPGWLAGSARVLTLPCRVRPVVRRTPSSQRPSSSYAWRAPAGGRGPRRGARPRC